MLKILIYNAIISEVNSIIIDRIERALGFKLYDYQIKYIMGESDDPRYDNLRGTGSTTVYCIRLALSSGDALDLQHPEKFSDGRYSGLTGSNDIDYSKDFFLHKFMSIRGKLYRYGFTVREVYPK